MLAEGHFFHVICCLLSYRCFGRSCLVLWWSRYRKESCLLCLSLVCAWVLSVIVWLQFILVSLVGYMLPLCLYLDIFYTSFDLFWLSICSRTLTITKTCLYNFEPLKPHFNIVKLEFTGVYIIFHISAQKLRLWVLVRTALARRI